eukprot:gene18878-20778_t
MAAAYDPRTADLSRVVLKEGYLKVTSRIFSKWTKKWAVLEKSPEKSIKLFKKEVNKKKNESCRVISLDPITSLDFARKSNSTNGLEMKFKNGRTEILVFESESQLKEWHDCLQQLCFKEDKVEEETDVLETAEYNIKTEHITDESTDDNKVTDTRDCFELTLLPSANLNVSGQCSLQITPTHVELHDLKDPEMFLASWPIATLRRFGHDQNKFLLETGRHCDTGEGKFAFRTKEGERINKIIQNYAELIATQKREHSSADDNDNDEFGLRPLPPIPPD